MKRNICMLGLAAGLGLAAIPAFSYAATEISGDTKVETEVTPAISMRIHSNADKDASGDDTYGVVTYNPATAQGSGETTSNEGPSLATGLNLSMNQKDLTTLYSNVEVRTNTGHFELTLSDNDEDTRLNLNPLSTEQNEYIETADGEPETAAASWAVQGGDISDWTAMPKSTDTPLTILGNGTNATSPLSYSDAVTVHYGVSSGTTKTGVYSDTVTYTAVAFDSDGVYTEIFNINGSSGSEDNIVIPARQSKTKTITPEAGFYVAKIECSAGYTCTGNTGKDATDPQDITIENNTDETAQGAVEVVYHKTVTANNNTSNAPAFYTISTMQEMTRDICQDPRVITPAKDATVEINKDNWETVTEGIPTIHLSDSRGGTVQTYTVKKLSDSQCWMTENLRLPHGTTITAADSDLDGVIVSSYTLPATNATKSNISSHSDRECEFMNDEYMDYTDNTYGYKNGGYYSWCTAVAGTGLVSNSQEYGLSASSVHDVYGTDMTKSGNNTSASICPKGWRLPTGLAGGDFDNLWNAYLVDGWNPNYISTKYFHDPNYGPNFAFAGDFTNYGRDYVGSKSRTWTSTTLSGGYAYYNYTDSYYTDPAKSSSNSKTYAYSVRCIAR